MIINPVQVWLIISPVIIYFLMLIGWFFRKVQGKSLVVLGMKGAGKTRFYRFLQNKPFIEGESGIDEYEEFEYKKQDGKTIYIRKGKDIGGSEDYINQYEDMIKKCDILVFCFDLNRYLSDSTYEKQVNARFDFVCRKFKELKHLLNIECLLLILYFIHLSKSGKEHKFKQSINIPSKFLHLGKSHLDKSGKEVKDMQPIKE